MKYRGQPISADEPVRRSARGYRGWSWPDPGGHSNTSIPRRLNGTPTEPKRGASYSEQYIHLRKAYNDTFNRPFFKGTRPAGDMTSRPVFPFPPAYLPSGLYRARNNPGSVNWRTGGPHGSSFRFPGIPSGMVRPFGITVERTWVHDLIQQPYRTQHRPILRWNERPQPAFYAKTTRSLPIRPAVAYPTYNFRPYDEEKAIEQARMRAGLRKKRGR